MSISVNYPAVLPSLSLDFSKVKALDPRITFTRASSATLSNNQGMLVTVANNVPRFDYEPVNKTVKGLLIEEQRTNLFTYSNNYTLSPGGWTLEGDGSRTQDLVGPDGVANSAWTIADTDTRNDFIRFYKQITVTPSNTTNYCISSFVKATSTTNANFYCFFQGNSVKGSYINYNFTTDTLTAFASDGGGITPTIFGRFLYPNGWRRIYFVVNDSNNGLNNTLQYRIYPGGRDNSSNTTIGLYGTQIEIGSFPTSYIPTVASQVTRSADTATITGTNFSSWYKQSAGTVYAEWIQGIQGSANSTNQLSGVWGISQLSLNGVTFNGYGVSAYQTATSNEFSTSIQGRVRYVPTSKNDVVYFGPNSYLNTGQKYNSAFAWSSTEIAGTYARGTVVTTTNNTAADMGTHDLMEIGTSFVGGSGPYFINGHIRKITYYSRRLSNTEMQALTTL